MRHARPELAHCDYKGAVSTPQMGPKIASSLLGINEAPLKLVHSPEPPKKQVTGPSPAEVEALKRALELEQQNRALERELQRKKQEEDEAKRKREAEEKQRREREREVEEKKQRAIEFEKKRRAAMDPVDRPLDDTVLQLLSKLSSGLRATKVSNNWMQSQRDVVLAVCKRPLPKDDGALFYCLEWDSKKRADYDRLFICHGVTVTTTVKSLPKELNPRKDYAFTITPDEEQVFGWQPVTVSVGLLSRFPSYYHSNFGTLILSPLHLFIPPPRLVPPIRPPFHSFAPSSLCFKMRQTYTIS